MNAFAVRAAHRAQMLLTGQDADDAIAELVELLHEHPNDANIDAITRRAGLRPSELAKLRAAYRFGGTEGVHVIRRTRDVDPETVTRAAEAIADAGSTLTTPPTVQDNTITYAAVGIQLRLGADNRWYPFTRTNSTWSPTPSPATDPVQSFRAAERAVRARGG